MSKIQGEEEGHFFVSTVAVVSLLGASVKTHQMVHFIFILFYPHLRIYLLILRGRERAGKRNIDVRKTSLTSGLWTHPDLGQNPQCRHVPRPGIKSMTFGLQDNTATD